MKLSHCRAIGLVGVGFIVGCTKQASPSAVVVAQEEQSSHFESVSRHLGLGGPVYTYIDVDGNSDQVAEMLQDALTQIFRAVPALSEASRFQLKPVFQALHVEDLKAVGMSSVKEPNGEYRNNVFLATPEGRHGLMAIFGGPAAPLKHLKLAPADADCYVELEFNVPALTAAIKQVIIAVKGKAAADQMQQQMEAGGSMMGVSPLALVHSLKGRVTMILRTEPDKTIAIPGPKSMVLPRFALLLGIDGLAAPLKEILNKSPFLEMKEENGRAYYASKMPLMIDGLQPGLAVDGDDLYFGSDEHFLHDCLNRAEGAGLAEQPEFHRLLAELGPDVNEITYVTPRIIQQLRRLTDLNPNLDPEVRRNLAAKMKQVPVPDRPLMTVVQNLPDGVWMKARANRSLKLQMIMAVTSPLEMAAAVLQQRHALLSAIPNAPAPGIPVRPRPVLSPDERVRSNLSLLKRLADAYYRRSQTDTAAFSDLVGPGKLIPSLRSVEGEDYSTIHFRKGEPLEVKLQDGRIIKYEPPMRK